MESLRHVWGSEWMRREWVSQNKMATGGVITRKSEFMRRKCPRKWEWQILNSDDKCGRSVHSEGNCVQQTRGRHRHGSSEKIDRCLPATGQDQGVVGITCIGVIVQLERLKREKGPIMERYSWCLPLREYRLFTKQQVRSREEKQGSEDEGVAHSVRGLR